MHPNRAAINEDATRRTRCVVNNSQPPLGLAADSSEDVLSDMTARHVYLTAASCVTAPQSDTPSGYGTPLPRAPTSTPQYVLLPARAARASLAGELAIPHPRGPAAPSKALPYLRRLAIIVSPLRERTFLRSIPEVCRLASSLSPAMSANSSSGRLAIPLTREGAGGHRLRPPRVPACRALHRSQRQCSLHD